MPRTQVTYHLIELTEPRGNTPAGARKVVSDNSSLIRQGRARIVERDVSPDDYDIEGKARTRRRKAAKPTTESASTEKVNLPGGDGEF